VDDLYVTIGMAYDPASPDSVLDALSAGEASFADIRAAYSNAFGLKDEDSTVFVGMHVGETSSGTLTLKPTFDHSKHKFHHSSSARTPQQLLGAFVGQLCGTADRILDTSFPTAMGELFLHAASLGYSDFFCRLALSASHAGTPTSRRM